MATKHKLLMRPDGVVLACIPLDKFVKWGKRDLEGGRYAKEMSLTETQVHDIRHGKTNMDGEGKLALRPETEWPETIMAKQEREAEVLDLLRPKLEGVDEDTLRAIDDLLMGRTEPLGT